MMRDLIHITLKHLFFQHRTPLTTFSEVLSVFARGLVTRMSQLISSLSDILEFAITQPVIYFYIPLERPKPGGHTSLQSVVLPRHWNPLYGVLLNLTARIYIDSTFTMHFVSITLTILFAPCIFSSYS